MRIHDPSRYDEDLKDVSPTFVTRSGEVLKSRLISPADKDLLVDLAYHLSPETARRRFHQSMQHFSRDRVIKFAEQLADVDNLTVGGAILALNEEEDGEHIVGVSRLGRSPTRLNDPMADAAIVIRDDYQGEGVGTEMLRRLVLLAKEMGVKTMLAMIESDNINAIRLFRELGLPTEEKISMGETTLTIQMPG